MLVKGKRADAIKGEENEFLHDLANPVCTALFLTEVVVESFQVRPELIQDELLQLKEILKSLGKVKNLIQDRKELLEKKGVVNAGS